MRVSHIWGALVVLAVSACTAPNSVGTFQHAVGVGGISTDLPSYTIGDPISATYSGGPGNALDWVAISMNGSDPSSYTLGQYVNGGATADTLIFSSASLSAGSYVARLYSNDSYTVVYESPPFDVTPAVGPTTTVSSDASSYNVGDPITVNFAGMLGSATDWIAIAPDGAPDTGYTASLYTGGGVSGSVQFNNIPAGNYRARAYFSDSYSRAAESDVFVVQAGGGGGSATVTTGSSSYTTAQAVDVAFTNLSGNALDWIAIAEDGSPDTSYVLAQYAGGQVNGGLNFNGLSPGSYRARAFLNNSYNKVAESVVFNVTAGPPTATVTTDASSYVVGSTITVSFTGLGASSTDWISLTTPGAPATSYIVGAYTGGSATGSVQFTAPPIGTYVARAYLNNSYTVAAESVSFVVTQGATLSTNKATYAQGETITVTFAGLSGSSTDWIGVFSPGTTNVQYLAATYTGGGTSGTATISAPSVDGPYVVRAFNMDSYVSVAESSQFNVAAVAMTLVTPDSFSYPSGASVTISFSGFQGTAFDWIAIADSSVTDYYYVASAYTGGGTSGTVILPAGAVPDGTWVVRGYFNDSFNRAAESAPFTIGGP